MYSQIIIIKKKKLASLKSLNGILYFITSNNRLSAKVCNNFSVLCWGRKIWVSVQGTLWIFRSCCGAVKHDAMVRGLTPAHHIT